MASNTDRRSTPSRTRSDNFVGREHELEKLDDLLEKNSIVVVEGMHGVGKTELAREYICKHGGKYGGNWHWFDLRDRQLVDVLANDIEDITLLTEQTDPSAVSKSIWKKLEKEIGQRNRGLVVLDNVAEAAQINGMLPTNPRFRLLVMTDKCELVINNPNAREPLYKLEPEAALKLLEIWVAPRVEAEPEAADRLCNELLWNLPLGIELAGRYLQQDEKISIADFNTELENEQEKIDGKIDKKEPPESWRTFKQERGVQSVLELSWRRLDPQSQMVCKSLGLFMLKAIPWEVAIKIGGYTECREAGGIEACRRTFRQILRFIKASPEQAKRLNPKELCEKLVNLGLIKIVDKDNKDNKVILDTLIRKFLLEKAQASEYLKQEFVNVMFFECKQHLENGNFRFAAITSHFEVVITLLLHFEEVANKYIRLVSDAEFDRLFMNVGRFYDSRGMYSAEFQWYGMWLEKANRRLGSHPCSTDTKLKNLEYMYAEIGKPPEAPPNGKPPKAPPEYKPPKAAQPGYKRALEICEQLLKQDPLEKKDLASSLYDLGELLFKESKYSAALPLYERIVKIVEDKEEKNNKLESDTQLKAKNSIDEAKSEAKKLIDKAQSEAEKLEPAARSEAENLIATAQSEAKKSIDKAQSEAEKLEPAARSEAENLIATAQSIALILRQETSSFNANAQEKAEAKSKGGKLISEAQSKGDKLISEAQDKSNELISKAQSEGGKLISEAQDKSNELISEAQDKSNELISKAQSEGDKLISKARKKVDVETNLKNDKSKADTKLKKDAQSKAEECRNGIHNNKSVF